MAQIVELGKSPATCKCGQEEKIVVLVGRTQHGKSSLIRSILDYSGFEKEADRVKVGSFGNDSTTKHTKQFAVCINLQRHVLMDGDGIERIVDFRKDDIEDMYDFVPSTEATSDHVHLRILDTPGLDDSDNLREAEKAVNVGGSPQVRIIDERHKFSILRAISVLGKIHTVCFVLDIGNNLGASIQSQFKEYLEIFTLSKLAASFHFAHTKVDIDKRFLEKTCNRPAAVNKTFSLGYNSSHHFIENLPDKGDEISVHFSNWGLSGLLRSISRHQAQLVTQLNYPKSDAQRLMDEILKSTLKTQEVEWAGEIDTLEAQKSQWTSTKRDVDKRASTELKSWKKVHTQAEELDMTTLVQVGFQEKYERSHFFNRSRLSFFVHASSPIRHFELEKSTGDSGCHWVGEPTSLDTFGKDYCFTDLISWSSGTAIWGKVKLMGWIKEAKADELKVFREEESEAWKDYTTTIRRAEALEASILETDQKVKSLRQRIKEFRLRYSCLSLSYIPMEVLKTSSQYLASVGIISYAYGIGLKIDLRSESALNLSQIQSGHKKVFEEKQRVSSAMHKTATGAVKELGRGRRKQTETLISLNKTIKTIERHLETTRQQLTSIQKWHPPAYPRIEWPHTEEAMAMLGDVTSSIHSHVNSGTGATEEVLYQRWEMLQKRLNVVRKRTAALEPFMLETERTEERYKAKVADLDASIAAADHMLKLLPRGSLFVGVLAALRENAHKKPLDQLEAVYVQLKEVYSCDVNAWEKFIKEF
ncbi:hypothetical protein BKA60DRAFT_659752 [Fusarium oxysporum]|uniref:G domain-containing protein n=1 Tax=Fusarium oxysporum TaxID=5507 RepID=A0A420N925_FUSOX|nr:hypothetical protein BKA60DRAFT_659752 [Fusarium oxysporum]RKK76769.1 hypothetical protein BFJ69_g6718 [Fusarium oxysporum]